VRELENKLAYTVAKYEKEIASLKKEILAPKIKFTSKMGQFEKVLQVACMVCNVTPAEVLSKMRRGDIMTTSPRLRPALCRNRAQASPRSQHSN
jgi:hypothetical protein